MKDMSDGRVGKIVLVGYQLVKKQLEKIIWSGAEQRKKLSWEINAPTST